MSAGDDARAPGESEARFRALFEQAGDPVFVHAADGRFVDVNRAACESLGYTREQLVQLHVRDVDPYTVDEAPRLWARIQAGERVTFESCHIRADGARFPVEICVGPIRFGEEVLVLAIARDLTRRRQAENRIRQQARMLDSVGEAVVATDVDMKVVYCNRAAERLLGFEPGELLGVDAFSLMGPVTKELVETRRAEFLEKPGWFDGELEYGRKDGSTFVAMVSAGPLNDASGAPVGFVSVARDLTERRRLEAELLQARKMEAVGRLAGGIAHDFNNILTAIKGFTGLLMSNTAAADPRLADLREIDRAADHAAQLTRQLLAFGRKQLLAPRSLQLNDVVADLERMLRRILGEQVELVTELQPGLPEVRVDPAQLQQVIVNLIVNARDAMQSGGRLRLATSGSSEEPERWVELSVADEGEGMDAATLERIFEPFFTTKGTGRGVGLGLSTVHGIVEQSGGRILAQSTPGKGSVFRVRLPAATAGPQAEQATPRGRPAQRPAAAGERVLLVEDDPLVRGLGRRTLEQAGYRVLEAADGVEALERLERDGPVELVVTDAVMPRMGGLELAERLATSDSRPRVLVVSGYDAQLFGRPEAPGELSFLAKPYTPEVLLERVRDLLRQGSGRANRGA